MPLWCSLQLRGSLLPRYLLSLFLPSSAKAINALTAPIPADELQEMLQEVDRDGSGVLSFSEFLRLVESRKAGSDPQEELKEVFK